MRIANRRPDPSFVTQVFGLGRVIASARNHPTTNAKATKLGSGLRFCGNVTQTRSPGKRSTKSYEAARCFRVVSWIVLVAKTLNQTRQYSTSRERCFAKPSWFRATQWPGEHGPGSARRRGRKVCG